MDYLKLKTEELCDIIVHAVGIPIPTYSYDYQKYITVVPENINIGDSVTGIEKTDMHYTFKDACIHIIKWNNDKI